MQIKVFETEACVYVDHNSLSTMLGIQQVLRCLKNACRWIDLWGRGRCRNYTKDRGMPENGKGEVCPLRKWILTSLRGMNGK